MIRQTLPEDQALPQLRRLLDTEAMAPVLGRMLDGAAAPDAVRISYLRYKPGRRLLVCYEVQAGNEVYQAVGITEPAAGLAARATERGSVKLADKVAERTAVLTPLAYEPELDALIQWSPLDLELPALAEPPERLRRELAEAGVELEGDDLPRLVKHKPHNRAIMRLDRHVVKIYADESSFVESVHATHKAAALPFRTASCEAIVPDRRMLVQAVVPGRIPVSSTDLTRRAASVLAQLHAADIHGLPHEDAQDQLEDAAGDAELAAILLPSLAGQIGELMEELERRLPDAELVPSHGGYRRSQLLDADGELGVIDFDGFCRSPAARDLASFAASFVETPDDVPVAFETLDVLTDAYGRRPTGLTWYLATYLLRRTRRPFTRLEADWPDAVEERLRAVELALELER